MTETEIYNEIKKIGGLDKIFIPKKQLKEELQVTSQLLNIAFEVYIHWVIAGSGSKGYKHLQHSRKYENLYDYLWAINKGSTSESYFVAKPVADDIRNIVALIRKGGKYEKEVRLASYFFYDLTNRLSNPEQNQALTIYGPVAPFFNDNFGNFLEEV